VSSSLLPGTSRYAPHISLTGTIPIDYKGATYNIPVSILVPHPYPGVAPVPYVTPTPQMVLKDGHRHVMPSGQVRSPYLDAWRPGASSLFELLTHLASLFSTDPPVYARASTSTSNPVHANPVPQSVVQGQSHNPTHPAYNTYGAAPQNQLVAHHTSRVRAQLAEFARVISAEMAKLGCELQELQARRAQLGALQESGATELSRLEAALRSLVDEEAALGDYVARNGHRGLGDDAIDVDAVGGEYLGGRAQLVEALAEDAAWDDALYYADKALEGGVLGLDAYVRSTRDAARKQFMARALSIKLRQLKA
jgi:ESCRT-I complex subunit TSG101